MNNVNKKSNNFFSLENVFISSSILFALFCLLACFVKFCNAHSLYTVSLERYFLKLYPKRQDFSLFWKQIHVSSSSKFIITLLIRGNTLFYSSNNFNDQHVKCKPKICQRNLSNMSECSIALEMAADSTISPILRYSQWYMQATWSTRRSSWKGVYCNMLAPHPTPLPDWLKLPKRKRILGRTYSEKGKIHDDIGFVRAKEATSSNIRVSFLRSPIKWAFHFSWFKTVNFKPTSPTIIS